MLTNCARHKRCPGAFLGQSCSIVVSQSLATPDYNNGLSHFYCYRFQLRLPLRLPLLLLELEDDDDFYNYLHSLRRCFSLASCAKIRKANMLGAPLTRQILPSLPDCLKRPAEKAT